MGLTKTITDHFIREEGYRLRSYPDIFGYWTIGIGHFLGSDIKFANLVWTDKQVMEQFEKDFNEAVKTAKALLSNFDSLPEKTKLGITDMAFNMGYSRLSKFNKTLEHLRNGRLQEASAQALKSKWAKQLPNRSKRVAELLKG
jgi:lysozyme